MFEHPCTASSWEDRSLCDLIATKGVIVSVLDMCRYGMVASDKLGEAPVRKTTRIATNVPEIAQILSARCEGGHRHVHLVSGRTRHAAVYSEGFCQSVIRGFQLYRRRRSVGIRWSGDERDFEDQHRKVGALLNFSRADLCDPDEEDIGGRYVDDIKGTEMDPKWTREARREEIE